MIPSPFVWPAAQEPQPALSDLIDMDDSFRDWVPGQDCKPAIIPPTETHE